MQRNPFLNLGLLIVVALALSLTGCGATEVPGEVPEATVVATEASAATQKPEPTTAIEEEPVVLRVGGLEDVDCWNPFGCASTWTFGHLINEGFTDHGPVPGCSGIPRLAESWEVSEDGRTWTIHLYEGITYSDGTPFTAQTAADYFNWYVSTEMKEWTAETLYLESAEAIDELTFQYTTSAPILNSPDYDFQWLYMMPVHIWGDVPAEELFTHEVFPPVTTGPYVVAEHVPGSYLVYEARPEYYRGKPPIDRIVYQIYGNIDAIASALIAGEIDMTMNELPPDVAATLSDQPNIFVEVKVPGPHHMLVFNLAPGGTRHPAVEDVAVREAMDYAIDKDWIVDVALLGYGITCPNNWACGPNYADQLNPDLEVTPYDVDRANEILDQAGYLDSDKDGIRETADGLPLEFRFYYVQEVPSHVVIAEAIVNWVKEIGITLIPEAVEAGTWDSSIRYERDFDVALGYGAPDIDAAAMDFSYSCWSSEAGGVNWSGYCNPEMDDLVYQFWLSSDYEASLEPLFQAQELLYNDRPQLILAAQNDLQAWRTDRFEFPVNSCDLGGIMVNYWALSQAKPK